MPPGIRSRLSAAVSGFLRPRLCTVLLGGAVSALLLYHALRPGNENSPAVWIAYPLSTWSFVQLCILAWKDLRSLAERMPFLWRLMQDFPFRERFFVGCSLVISLLYALFYGVQARRGSSLWFLTLAFFQAVLASVRFFIALYYLRGTKDARAERLRYRFCGYFLLLLSLAVVGLSLAQIRFGAPPAHSFLIYGTAAYTFFSLGLALRNVLRFRKSGRLIVLANKDLCLSQALVSLFTLQAVLLVTFGDGNSRTSLLFTSILGFAVFAAILGIALRILRKCQVSARMS